jgi:enolase
MKSDTRIASVHARRIFDSRGRPTVEADVTLRSGATGHATAPSGASTGRHEAHELRDGDPSAYEGRGVSCAIDNVNVEIASLLTGRDAADQSLIDTTMREADGTDNLSRLGANAVIATSMAVCRASAHAQAMPLYRYIAMLTQNERPTLPMPMVNILSGGAHARRGTDLQDFLVIPVAAKSYTEALQSVLRVRASADRIAAQRGLTTLLADEGGLSPGCKRTTDALDLLMEAIEHAGFVPGRDIAIALDVAGSELFADGRYRFHNESLELSSAAMIETILDWLRHYPIISIEDALHQDDWDNWVKLTSVAASVQLVGDDLFATSVSRIAHGIRTGAANAVLIKPNQNGTLSGTLDALAQARTGGFATIVSARSGETEDSFIADLAVGTGAGQIKIGSVRTSERMCKYNRLIRIGEDSAVSFSGIQCFSGAAPRQRHVYEKPSDHLK